MNRRIVFLTLIGLMVASLLLSACATEDVPGPRGDLGPNGPVGPHGQLGPQGDLGPKGPLGPDFSDDATSVGTNVAAKVVIILAAVGLGLAVGVLVSIVTIRARKPSRSVANSR